MKGGGSPAVPLPGPRPLVLLDPVTARQLSSRIADLEQRGAVIHIADYRRLMAEVETIRRRIDEHHLDFLLFSRNDQVFDRSSIGPLIRALRVGYSTFSGIDPKQASQQGELCLDDYLAGSARLNVPVATARVPTAANKQGTFSLVFDLEQLGGARFGLPRILALLERYDVKATFFTTSFVRQVYGNALELIRERGHEIGLHGRYHEYLDGRPIQLQTEMIRCMRRDFEEAEPIRGANFVYRMDHATVTAIAAAGLRYFVTFLEHGYRPFRYREMPLRPMRLWTPQGLLWLMPISVETYSRPWAVIQKMLRATVAAGRQQQWPHVSVLMHPFRDGSLSHLGVLERMIEYLRGALAYQSATLATVMETLPAGEPQSFLYYRLDDAGKAARENGSGPAWHQDAGYRQRIGRLYQDLETQGRRPALCLELPPSGPLVGVYPFLPESTAVERIVCDPLAAGQAFDFDALADGRRGSQQFGLVPPTNGASSRHASSFSPPRCLNDCAGLVPELAVRVLQRLRPGREIF